MKKLALYALALIAFLCISGCKEQPNEVVNNYYDNNSYTDPNTPLKVVYNYPADGQKGPLPGGDITPNVTIQFNKLLNIIHSIPMVTISDGKKTFLFYQGSSYPDDFPYILTLEQPYMKYLANKTYTVTVDTTLMDIHGYTLDKPYSFSFIPEPYFRVIASQASSGINSKEYILNFNSPVPENVFSHISISPGIQGTWQYYNYSGSTMDSSVIMYRFSKTLEFDTKYTFSVDGSAKDINGLTIQKPYSYSFTTEAFKAAMTSYSSGIGPGGFQIYNYIDFQFNGVVDTSSVSNSIRISPAIKYKYSFYNNSSYYSGKYNVVKIRFDDTQFLRDTQYKIIIEKTARSEGGTYMKEPYTYSFTTGN